MKVAILVNYGPEIRPFFENNLNDMMSDKVDFIYFIKKTQIRNKLNDKLKKKAIFYEINQFKSKTTFLKRLFLKFDSYFIQLRKTRQRRMKVGNYHFTTGTDFNTKKTDIIWGSELVYVLMRGIYNFMSGHFFYSKYITELFKTNGITDILYYGSNMYEMRHFIHTAQKNKIRLWHYVGNWKDIYIDDFIPIIPEKIFVWSDKIKNNLLKFNKSIKKDKVVVSGNLFFHHFKNYKPVNNFDYYCTKYHLNDNSIIYLWPLSMRVVFPNEHFLIAKVDEFIENNFTQNKPVILLRDNPMGAAKEHIVFYTKLKNIRLAEDFWQVSREEDFTFQTTEGENEWTDLLYYSRAVISTPSTVTLESILFGKSSLNILFDETGEYSKKIAAFAIAPFYVELLERDDVILCNNINEFKKILGEINSKESILKGKIIYPKIIDGNKNSDIQKFVNIITH